MSFIMSGVEVAKTRKEELALQVEMLKQKQVEPYLAILRVGERPDDLAYEKGALKRMEMLGIRCGVTALPQSITQEEFDAAFDALNENEIVHGILVFQPLPDHLKIDHVKNCIDPQKDMDCICDQNVVKLFTGDPTGYAPCTAEAVMEMLHFYQIPVAGRRVVILGRSLVIGKPLSMLMLGENATVTLCHSKSENLKEICCEADILVAAVGRAKMVTKEFVKEGAVVVDVGINLDENGALCGDVDFENVVDYVSYISPVPRGVGSITTSILAKHVLQAAKNRC